MALFELFIPARDDTEFDITARIRATNWMHALRDGLAKLGQGVEAQNVLCDIHESSMDVTDPLSGRVFSIRELDDPEVSANAEPAPMEPLPISEAKAALPTPDGRSASPEPDPHSVARLAEALSPSVPSSQASPAAELVAEPSSSDKVSRVAPEPSTAKRVLEDVIAELFDETADLHAERDLRRVAMRVLELAIGVIPSESGSVYVVNINHNDFHRVAARGPQAEEVMKSRGPTVHGFVGGSTPEGLNWTNCDAQRDPDLLAEISERLGYDAHSILCAPAQKNGRVFGALQLINKVGNPVFTDEDLNILDYISYQFADYLENREQSFV